MSYPTRQRGQELIAVIVLISVTMIVGLAVISLLRLQQREGRKLGQSEQVYHVAEAGINYYRWHLAHNSDDFQDGTGAAGPYVHDFINRDGVVIGQYSLTITPPPSGSTITTIRSTASLTGNPVSTRTIVARLGIASLSRYAVVANDNMRFGSGTETFGPIHSNGGIRFDGIAHGLVTSYLATYQDPDFPFDIAPGVHTHQPDPNAVFLGGRQYPVTRVNFNGITADLASLRAAAIANGIYLTASGTQGYHLTFRSDDKVDMRKVTAQVNCTVRNGGATSHSIATESSFTYNAGSSLGVPLPANGIIFIEDDVWVNGQIDSARVTVVAARDPLSTGSASIIANNDLTYTNYDGRDAIGLIAQNDFSVGLVSENDLRIDAAIIAQGANNDIPGRAGRYYYPTGNSNYSPSGCQGSNPVRAVFTNLGSIVTNKRYGFAYTDNTGYTVRNLNWDDHLLFAPPPLFPTTGQFTVLNWDEQN